MNNFLTNISNFIKNNKIIMCLLFVLFLLIVWTYAVPYITSKLEHLDTTITNDLKITDVLGKYVHLKCDCEIKEIIDNKVISKKDTYYLAIAEKKDCSNIKPNEPNECGSGIAMIQKDKNDYSTFLVEKGFGQQSMYTISTIVKDIVAGVLSQNLNHYKNIGLACFDGGLDDIINFEIEERNDGNLIKFRKLKDKTDAKKGYIYYYLGLCEAMNATCKIGTVVNKRLCLYKENEKDKAVGFRIELASKQPITSIQSSVESESHSGTTQEHSSDQEHLSEHFSLFGNESLLSSTGSTISLPGAISQKMETVKPWVED
ncbi:hypothetical protein QKU48_gp0804 [Fadolivirus algeromassiliense]|jgi:hypothetical protein|uniref:Uncharacterized protein n=1 Tax=Fadolivirus FV1/VV64 TaxID=3070911 RepID=A0A7D3R174_9VIRU|nr:hypothetical protein QKU48_gp0804 [Fadolivirus algeromassiliense]QKF94262.1 hypothetical protein Fadolivirus_1_804 [Fadolivirus FV1/VV64]